MPKDSENIPIPELPAHPAPVGFSPQQMIRCDECLRANPPTRIHCLYCGEALPLNDAAAALVRPSLRPLESWEPGFNLVVLRSTETVAAPELAKHVGSLLRLEPSVVQRVLTAQVNLPLARIATPEDAALIEQRLAEVGLKTITVSDHDLQVEKSPPQRLRGLTLVETGFVAHQILNREGAVIDWEAITLVVAGRIFVKQMQVREKKRRIAENRILDSREIGSDESVVDIYVRNHSGNWRITANSFDFSVLGERKSLFAAENFPRLLTLIREHARQAEYNEAYQSARDCLDLVWPSAQRSEAAAGRARISRGTTTHVITTDSEQQFTRYSRLCHYLKTRCGPDQYEKTV